MTGFDFSYSAETARPRFDGPERFLHFDVQLRRAGDPLPPDTHPAKLGGRRGLLAPATSRNYANEPYFANHVRFFWRERGIRYAATLHNFGAKTKTVLGAIVRGLRPAKGITPPPSPAPGGGLIQVPIAGPKSVAVNSAGVWVAGTGNHGTALIQLAPNTGKVLSGPIRISRYAGPTGLATSRGLWLCQFGFHQPDILRLRQDGKTFANYFTAGMSLNDLSVTEPTIWALDFGTFQGFTQTTGGTVERLDRRTGNTVARIPVGDAPAQLALGAGSVWVTNNLDDTVTRINAVTNHATKPIHVGSEPVGIAIGFGGVWVANSGDNSVSRIDPESGLVTETIRVGRGPRSVAVGHGSVWATNYLDDTVSRIDPGIAQVSETIPVGAGPTGIAVGRAGVWVADMLDRTVSRIEP